MANYLSGVGGSEPRSSAATQPQPKRPSGDVAKQPARPAASRPSLGPPLDRVWGHTQPCATAAQEPAERQRSGACVAGSARISGRAACRADIFFVAARTGAAAI